ncbi:hypothetical protein os4_36140 (plasmid) [Comamonadaceae bacterium OS-4]|nr:hypothetical protein os4_36140 [Comamonadaceae bacterium OS-4]
MSEAIRSIKNRIESKKYSRAEGLRAICARAELYQAVHGGPAIKYEWLRKVVDGRTPNPGIDRIEQLGKVLDALDQEQEQGAK